MVLRSLHRAVDDSAAREATTGSFGCHATERDSTEIRCIPFIRQSPMS